MATHHAREAQYFTTVAATIREVITAATDLRTTPIGLEPIDNRVRNSTLDSVISHLMRQAEAFDTEARTHRAADVTERSRCGIHGDSTATGRCPSCDAAAVQN